MKNKLISVISVFILTTGFGWTADRSSRRVAALTAHIQKTGRLPVSMPQEGITTIPADVYLGVVADSGLEECLSWDKLMTIFPGLAVESACRIVWPLPTGDDEAISRLQNGGFDRTYLVTLVGKDMDINTQVKLANGVTIEPNYIADINGQSAEPNDPEFSSQYALKRINVLPLWGLGIKASSEAKMFVMDTGISVTNRDLAHTNPVISQTFGDRDPLADEYGHGTHVGGIACALGDNEFGISGVMQSCDLISLKISQMIWFGFYGYPVMTIENIVQALAYINTISYDGPMFLNMSLGQFAPSEEMEQKITAVKDRVFLAAAAGNFSADAPQFPGRLSDKLPNVVCVGAIYEDGVLWGQSDRGSQVNLLAPGVGVLSSVPYGFVRMTGTSMATPHVMGAAGLLFAGARKAGVPARAMKPWMFRTALVRGAKNIGLNGVLPDVGELDVYRGWQEFAKMIFPVISKVNPASVTASASVSLTVSKDFVLSWSDLGVSLAIKSEDGSSSKIVPRIKGDHELEFDAPSVAGKYSVQILIGKYLSDSANLEVKDGQ